MAGAGQGADIGAGAEHIVLARADHHGAHLRVLEAQPLHRVRELDIDAEIVGIELQLGAGEEAAGWIDVEGQGRDRPVAFEAPMAVAGGLGGKIDDHRHVRVKRLRLAQPISIAYGASAVHAEAATDSG